MMVELHGWTVEHGQIVPWNVRQRESAPPEIGGEDFTTEVRNVDGKDGIRPARRSMSVADETDIPPGLPFPISNE